MQAPTRYQRGNNRQSTSSAQTPSTPAFGFTSTPAQPANAAPSQEPISFEKLDEASKKFILDVQYVIVWHVPLQCYGVIFGEIINNFAPNKTRPVCLLPTSS